MPSKSFHHATDDIKELRKFVALEKRKCVFITSFKQAIESIEKGDFHEVGTKDFFFKNVEKFDPTSVIILHRVHHLTFPKMFEKLVEFGLEYHLFQEYVSDKLKFDEKVEYCVLADEFEEKVPLEGKTLILLTVRFTTSEALEVVRTKISAKIQTYLDLTQASCDMMQQLDSNTYSICVDDEAVPIFDPTIRYILRGIDQLKNYSVSFATAFETGQKGSEDMAYPIFELDPDLDVLD